MAPSEGGHTFTVQEIYGQQTFKVVSVQINSRFLYDRLDIAAGRIVGQDDFQVLQQSCQFVSNAFCGGPKGGLPAESRCVLGRGIAFQPDIQYVIDPAGTKEINDALLVGAKIAIQL